MPFYAFPNNHKMLIILHSQNSLRRHWMC